MLAPSPLAVPAAAAITAWPVQSFVTESFHPVVLEVNKTGPTAAGYLLFAAEGEAASIGPTIMTDEGDLIWESELSQGNASAEGAQLITNVDIQQMDGNPYLTYFNGTTSGDHAYGATHVLDSAYDLSYYVCLRPGGVVIDAPDINPHCYGDLHESQFTDRGTILLSLYNVTRADLTSVGGQQDGWILDSQFYEVDIKTNDIKFAWKSLDHQDQIPINMTHYPISLGIRTFGTGQYNPFDYFHINSVHLMPDGGYLISSRHAWAVIKLCKDGEVEWILPGDRNGTSFEHIDPLIHFSWQHHARVSNVTNSGMLLHLHNNANSQASFGTAPTSGLLMQLDLSNPNNRTATLLRNLTDPNDIIFSFAEGSYQDLPNGNVLLGYGYVPQMKEFLPNGKVALSAQFGPTYANANSYRAFRLPWTGKPCWPPKAKAVTGMANATNLYMSWNGATEYDQWMVYTGCSSKDLQWTCNVTRAGFETNTTLKADTHGFAQVKAVFKGAIQSESEVVPF